MIFVKITYRLAEHYKSEGKLRLGRHYDNLSEGEI
jgi:hypothetical protein